MTDKLSQMTLEQLWHLFPIKLVPHSDEWQQQFEQERALLCAQCGYAVRISHIGSTAVEGIWAKPTVDILVEVTGSDFDRAVSDIAACGYRIMSSDEQRISFNKGYTPQGFADKVFHLHLRLVGDNDELYFRDYLRCHAVVAKQYEQLKLSLWKQHEFNRDAYTDAKTAFIKDVTARAKSLYPNRYA